MSEIIVMKALNDFFRFNGPPSLSEAHNMAPRVCADIGEEANMGWSFQVSKNDSVCPAYAGPSFFTFFLKAFWWHTTTGSTTGWSPFLFSNHHMVFTVKSRFVSHVFCWNLSQLKIRWTPWTLSVWNNNCPSDSGVSLVPAQRVSLPWSSCRWPNLWWIDVPGFKNESLRWGVGWLKTNLNEIPTWFIGSHSAADFWPEYGKNSGDFGTLSIPLMVLHLRFIRDLRFVKSKTTCTKFLGFLGKFHHPSLTIGEKIEISIKPNQTHTLCWPKGVSHKGRWISNRQRKFRQSGDLYWFVVKS